ncbi:unnamed protein product [Protopolystoma xenopodis]|uniref:Uncharacterized protein n=1 Tax=Protopolystoma xenopodis TaxID=117903 RepID=A0A448WCG0_9PLAT|nr:unnamed protein product [Protopolystoma xenopodis]
MNDGVTCANNWWAVTSGRLSRRQEASKVWCCRRQHSLDESPLFAEATTVVWLNLAGFIDGRHSLAGSACVTSLRFYDFPRMLPLYPLAFEAVPCSYPARGRQACATRGMFNSSVQWRNTTGNVACHAAWQVWCLPINSCRRGSPRRQNCTGTGSTLPHPLGRRMKLMPEGGKNVNFCESTCRKKTISGKKDDLMQKFGRARPPMTPK